MFKNKV